MRRDKREAAELGFLLRRRGVLLRQREGCDRGDRENTKNELHRRKLCAMNPGAQTRSSFRHPGGTAASFGGVSASFWQPSRPRVAAISTSANAHAAIVRFE